MKNEEFNEFENQTKYDIIRLEDEHKDDSKKKEIIDNLSQELEKVFNKTKEKVKDVKDSEQTQEFFEKAKEQVEKMVEATKKALEDFKEDDRVQDVLKKLNNTFDDVVESISKNETVQKVGQSVNDFMARDDVQEKIETAKDATIDFTQKVADGVKNLLKKKG
ncbi:hypothetical protein EDD63_10462 [Breznakia blatticola]|uniref:Uncharacterized protein n=1 Tax=Breznakia blatticola TaxID=1754012 RepID=A0A4R8A6W7_9FIRM|nr:hypothetical protein [Breznakia blatticola]TDW25534.1 hypothetical protein EDD63_10462 [Breznakia blatticola]